MPVMYDQNGYAIAASQQPMYDPNAYVPQAYVQPQPQYDPNAYVQQQPASYDPNAYAPSTYAPQPAYDPNAYVQQQPVYDPNAYMQQPPTYAPQPAYDPQAYVQPQPSYDPNVYVQQPPLYAPQPAYDPQAYVQQPPTYVQPQPQFDPNAYGPQAYVQPQPSYDPNVYVQQQPVYDPNAYAQPAQPTYTQPASPGGFFATHDHVATAAPGPPVAVPAPAPVQPAAFDPSVAYEQRPEQGVQIPGMSSAAPEYVGPPSVSTAAQLALAFALAGFGCPAFGVLAVSRARSATTKIETSNGRLTGMNLVKMAKILGPASVALWFALAAFYFLVVR
jgi:hypothetical protein